MKPSRATEYRRQRHALTYGKAFEVTVDISGLEQFLNAAESELIAAIRPAAQAGAQVIYEEVKRNASKIVGETGRLASSIYQVYSKMQSDPRKHAVYHISWNSKEAPHGHLVEYGHVQKYHVIFDEALNKWVTLKRQPLKKPKHIPPRPFLRPAMAHFPRALEAAKQEMFKQLKSFK